MEINDFKTVVRSAWSKDTCYKAWQKEWSEVYPSKGQCYVTAKLFQGLFGGILVKVKDSNNFSHYYNSLNDVEYDFTKEQYPLNEKFTNKETITEGEKNVRLDLLKLNFFKEVFKLENFPIIYEWYDKPNTEYPEHQHEGKVSLYVLDGSVAFTGGINETVSQYQRLDVPVGVKHTALVGSEGCRYIVGQEIENDA